MNSRFVVQATVSMAQNLYNTPVGTSAQLTFEFIPGCYGGRCAAVMTRTRFAPDQPAVRAVVTPDANGVYHGTRAYNSECFSLSTGAVIDPVAYNDIETITITPTAQSSAYPGDITTFTGQLSYTLTPTPAAAAKGCRPGAEVIDLTGQVATDVSLPTIDAGTFVKNLWGGRDIQQVGDIGGEVCTTAFSVAADRVRYVLGSFHCVGEASQFGRTALTSTFEDNGPRIGQFIFASSLDCYASRAKGTCLTPKSGQDYYAWKPDTAAPTGMLQVPGRLVPVLGTKSWEDLGGKQVCHYGQGSAAAGNAERCGTMYTKTQKKVACVSAPCTKGLVPASMFGTFGDSGGPVYAYNHDRSGVYAVGVVAQADGAANTMFYPIEDVLKRFKATIVTG